MAEISKVSHHGNGTLHSPTEVTTENVTPSVGVDTDMNETKEKVVCGDADKLSVSEPPRSKWAIGSETNSEDENETPMTESVSRKDSDPPVLDRKSTEDAASCASDVSAEVDVTRLTKKPRPRPIETITEGETTPAKRSSLHASGWESDDSDARHRSDSNASSQPLLSSKHASSQERMLAAVTAEAKAKQQEDNATDNNQNSIDAHAGERGGDDVVATSPSTPTANGAVSTDTECDDVHEGMDSTSTNLVTSTPETAPAEPVKPTLKRVPTATLLISEHGIDVVHHTVASTDDVITSMRVVKQISYRPPMPDNHLVLSCIVMFCCNPPFGLIAFIFSGKSWCHVAIVSSGKLTGCGIRLPMYYLVSCHVVASRYLRFLG